MQAFIVHRDNDAEDELRNGKYAIKCVELLKVMGFMGRSDEALKVMIVEDAKSAFKKVTKDSCFVHR